MTRTESEIMTRKQKKARRLRIVGFWLALIGLLFLIGGVSRIWRGLKNSVWDGESRVNFVFIDEDIFLISFDPGKKTLEVLEIPRNVEIEVIGGFGSYRIGAIDKLGEMEGRGGELLQISVQEHFGVPVDGWIKNPLSINSAQLNSSKFKTSLIGTMMRLAIKQEDQTNFTSWDVVRIWWGIRKTLSSQINITRLDDISALKSKILVDNFQTWELDLNRLNMFFQDHFYESEIREENLTIEVVNATEHFGLASRVARIVSNMGGRVVRVGNVPPAGGSGKCGLRSKEKLKDTFTVRKLLKVLGCGFIEEENSDDKAEIIILVGEGYWQILNER